MGKGGKARRTVFLECTSCVRKVIIKNQQVFPDILLKRIDTIRRLVD